MHMCYTSNIAYIHMLIYAISPSHVFKTELRGLHACLYSTKNQARPSASVAWVMTEHVYFKAPSVDPFSLAPSFRDRRFTARRALPRVHGCRTPHQAHCQLSRTVFISTWV